MSIDSLRVYNKPDADAALENGLIGIQDYARHLVSVEPLVDTLRDADEKVRKAATFVLKERGGRVAVELLEQALDDPSEEVRLFAAEALERLDTIYNEAINTLITLIRREPSAKLHYQLGKVYFDYARRGMYDRGMQSLYFEKAIREFERTVDLCGENEKLWLYLGTCHCATGDHEKALSLFERVLERHPDNAELLMKIVSIHFALRDYDRVRQLCERVRRLDESSYRDVLCLWT